MSVGRLDHFNLRTRKFDETVHFYRDTLGLEKGARPNFSFPAAWMYSDGKAVASGRHLGHPRTAEARLRRCAPRGVRQQRIRGHETTANGEGYDFRAVAVPGNELWQIFITDPNGVVVELHYETAKEAAT